MGIKHGHAINKKDNGVSHEYHVWCGIIHRCSNEKYRDYHLYGGRGIKVCDRWKDFSNFIEDMGRSPSLEYSIERIDNNGNYCPENCKWATMHEQNRNKRTNVWVSIRGQELILMDALKLLRVAHYGFYKYKRNNGLTHQEAIDHYVETRL